MFHVFATRFLRAALPILAVLAPLPVLAAPPVHPPVRPPIHPADFPAPTTPAMDQSDTGVVASWTSPRSYDLYFVEYTVELPGQRAQSATDFVSGGPGGSMSGSYTVSPLPPIGATVLVRVTGQDDLLSGTIYSPPSGVGSYLVIGILHNPHISLTPKK